MTAIVNGATGGSDAAFLTVTKHDEECAENCAA
jgi:hypothetical protein